MKSILQYNHYLFSPSFNKRWLFAISFLLILFSDKVAAQTSQSYKEENFDVKLFSVRTISIPSAINKFSLIHFSGINVIDARADTGRVGCMQKKIADPVEMALTNGRKNRIEQRVSRRPTFLKLSAGVKEEAAQYAKQLLKFVDNDSLPRLLMVIKKMWLTDELILNKQHSLSDEYQEGPGKDKWNSGIDLRIEFYLQDQNAYYPLYRYDSVITTAMTVSEYGPGFIAMALSLSLEKIPQVDNSIATVYSRHRFAIQEIVQHNQKEYDIPVLRDTLTKRGVYMSFAEFRENNPSHQDFIITKERVSDILYIKQADGKEYVERKVWGYCTGKNIYVKTGENFFLLQRIENAFYVFALHYPTPDTGGIPSDSNRLYANYSVRNMYSLPLKPFQLDWSTGKLY